MFKVTFKCHSKVLNKTFTNVEMHKCLDSAKLRALALNWIIEKVEAA